MKKLVAALMLAGCAIGSALASQLEPVPTPSPTGWTRALVPAEHPEDDPFFVWTLKDSGDRGATLSFSCQYDHFVIATRHSLLDMSDVKDGQIMLAMLSTVQDRKVAEGFLTRDQMGVDFGEAAGDIKSWLSSVHGTSDPKVTFLLSNNGLRETFTFINEGGVIGEDFLSCKRPKQPKKKK